MSRHDSELDATTVKVLVQDPAHWLERPRAGFPFGNLDEERVLDADEIAAELEPEPAQTTHTASAVRKPPLPPRRPTLSAHSFIASRRPEQRVTDAPASAHPSQPSAAVASPSDMQALRHELHRLQSQMRARDAYLVELEQALDARTRQLAASGIASPEDAHRLLGRVRGQAFRIAELESELRRMCEARDAPKRTRAHSR
jgi:type IV secretory pathway VirB10-like protein